MTMGLKRDVLYDAHTRLGDPDYGSDQRIRMSLQTSGLDNTYAKESGKRFST